jgi:hypothetical protein
MGYSRPVKGLLYLLLAAGWSHKGRIQRESYVLNLCCNAMMTLENISPTKRG